ncbi:MAG: hypothetical protein QOJ90_383 [Actinomycetota bacterium]|jgi:hypothetical protein|nr:hypothetical protein [Actinomycetota bacterium]
MQAYDERLWPPLWLWIAGWLFALSLSVSFYAALGPVWGLLALLVPGGLVTAGLISAAARVQVSDGQLFAGPAHIGVEFLGPAEALDAGAARAVRGPESDPAGFHLIRGWVPRGVRARVVDPDDPTPYWFVASRHPDRLAAAIEAARSSV